MVFNVKSNIFLHVSLKAQFHSAYTQTYYNRNSIYSFLQTKCYKYWPGSKNEKENYGSVEVKLNHEETVGGIYTIRSLSIVKNGQEPTEVKQFHFTAWCDNWSSTCHSQFLDFIQTVREHCTFSKGPMVVHCRYCYIHCIQSCACKPSYIYTVND